MKSLAKSDRELLFARMNAYRLWLLQMEKDLHFEFNQPASGVIPWLEIIQQLAHRLIELDEEGRLSETLYQVDVHEGQLRSEMNSGNWNSWTDLLAHKVAEREAVKVIFRLQYAGEW